MSDKRTGYKRGRDKKTRRSVWLKNVSAQSLITVGGIGTIVAVSAVFLFLVWVVKDLLLSARVEEPSRIGAEVTGAEVLDIGVDEYRTVAWTLSGDGLVRAVRLDDGSALQQVAVVSPGGPAVTAYAKDPDGTGVVLGFEDGSVRLGRIGFETGFREADEVPAELRSLAPGELGRLEDGLAERTVRGQFRVQRLSVAFDDPVTFSAGVAIVGIHRAPRGEGVLVAAIDAEGGVALASMSRVEDMLTLEVTTEWSRLWQLATDRQLDAPEYLLITDLGSNLIVGRRSGLVERWAIRNLREARVAEVVDLAPGDAEISSLGLLLGGVTVICGRSDGRVGGWFVVRDPSNDVDGMRLVLAHQFDLDERSPVVAIATSRRERIFVVGTASGFVHSMYMTSNKVLAEIEVREGEPIRAVAIAPKNDAILAASGRGLGIWPIDPRHPEVTIGSMIGKVWYERYPEPDYVWQSSSGTDDFEPKLSLIPLIFGTIKATFYSMLLGVPLALLAAIYTSEFMGARMKARIKPLVELMASLPSVVLGFLAAVVIAPAAEQVVPALLTALVTVPLAILFSAFVWQALPMRTTIRYDFLRLPLGFVAMASGVALAFAFGGTVEDAMFAGDVRLWLDGQVGSGLAGWVILFLPVSAVAVASLVAVRINPWMRRATADLDRGAAGVAHLGKFLAAFATFVGLAALLAWVVHGFPELLGGEPWDLRQGFEVFGVDLSPFGTFDQRNALIVGFVMGFAIIPIIYTLAEDALSSVPDHLRAASLGAGATPWQTAVRIVVPTAMSGLFSACMVGLGRAVGETMIVLMAAGNTPVMSMNTFSGFRTLSANIATELPEAVRNSTHYRTLFLAALVLFAMTFVINTLAEGVRQRFRRRAYQL